MQVCINTEEVRGEEQESADMESDMEERDEEEEGNVQVEDL